jgi:hypothetical protein
MNSRSPLLRAFQVRAATSSRIDTVTTKGSSLAFWEVAHTPYPEAYRAVAYYIHSFYPKQISETVAEHDRCSTGFIRMLDRWLESPQATGTRSCRVLLHLNHCRIRSQRRATSVARVGGSAMERPTVLAAVESVLAELQMSSDEPEGGELETKTEYVMRERSDVLNIWTSPPGSGCFPRRRSHG